MGDAKRRVEGHLSVPTNQQLDAIPGSPQTNENSHGDQQFRSGRRFTREKALEAFKEIGKQLKGKNLSEALDSLLGGNDGDDGRKKPKARDLLRQFLKP